MQKNLFSYLLIGLVLLAVSCQKNIQEPTELTGAVNQRNGLTTTPTQQQCDKIGFVNLADGAILSSVFSDGGFGPIAMTSQNPRFLAQPHAAMVLNSAAPSHPESLDMGTPNGVAVPGGAGVGDAGESGTFINNVALGNIICIKNFDFPLLTVEDDVDGFVTFQFPTPVTATSITVIDVELTEVESASVELWDANGGNLLATIQLPSTGQNGVAVVSLGNTPGVGFIRVNMNGSQGIDNLAFCRDVPTSPCSRTQGYWKNHGPNASGNNDNEWPVTSLTLGTVLYTDVQLESILKTEVAGNGLISLAHQLIAAKLNIAKGTSATSIQSAITQADALIGALVVPPVGAGYLSPDAVSTLVNTLTQYNEGRLPGGPAHCN